MTFDKEIIREDRISIKRDRRGSRLADVVKTPAIRVKFTFPNKPGKERTLKIDNFTSGRAMIEAAEEWAAKQ
jgi:hypothetical protein